MTPKQAASIIGCTVGTVREAIRKGKIKAKRVPQFYGQGEPAQGFFYDISEREVEKYAKTKQARGYPRGKKRSA